MTNTIKHPECKSNAQLFNRLHEKELNSKKNTFMNPMHSSVKSKALTNIKRLKDAFILELAIPGFIKENLSLTLESNKLRISGNKTKTDIKIIRREFDFDNFERVFTLPENIDETSLQATIENGVLKVMFQLIPVQEPKKISIH
jgi:HSP20 family molecular chaperone IbpA